MSWVRQFAVVDGRVGVRSGACDRTGRWRLRVHALHAEHLGQWLGLMQVVALGIMDANGLYALEHAGVVHVLGYGFDLQHPGQVHEAPHGHVVQRVIDKVTDEVPVDFQDVHVQVLEITERGRPSAEVVQCDAPPNARTCSMNALASAKLVMAAVSVISRHRRAQICGPAAVKFVHGLAVKRPVADGLARGVDAECVDQVEVR